MGHGVYRHVDPLRDHSLLSRLGGQDGPVIRVHFLTLGHF